MNIPEGFEMNEDTGRMLVTSLRTGKTYAIEPIGMVRTDWGDVDPATKETTGSYGNKYRGSIDEEESVIAEGKGFIRVRTLKPGQSPIAAIQEIDARYPDRA